MARLTKQKATGETPEISRELLAKMKSDPGGGVSHDFIDDAFWQDLPPTSADWAWLAALDQLDRLRDERPLNALRRSCKPSPRIQKYLDDLIDRVRAKKGRGRRRTPAYTLSRNDALLLMADECVRAYIQRDHLSVAKALDKVASEWAWVPINRSTLAAVHNGCHASLNRHRKRL